MLSPWAGEGRGLVDPPQATPTPRSAISLKISNIQVHFANGTEYELNITLTNVVYFVFAINWRWIFHINLSSSTFCSKFRNMMGWYCIVLWRVSNTLCLEVRHVLLCDKMPHSTMCRKMCRKTTKLLLITAADKSSPSPQNLSENNEIERIVRITKNANNSWRLNWLNFNV